jgi:hypothetical protein
MAAADDDNVERFWRRNHAASSIPESQKPEAGSFWGEPMFAGVSRETPHSNARNQPCFT